MAYLDFSERFVAADVQDADVIEPGFSPREWSVIGLAHYDTRASLHKPGRIRRFVERLFDVRRANALADPRLEALRRMTVLLRRGVDKIASGEIERFFASGYTQLQLAALAGHLGKAAR